MRTALLAAVALSLIACSHGAPAPAATASSTKGASAPDAGVGLRYPVARKVDVVDDYHGTKVADPYRWLEDPSSPGYREWIDAQNTLTEGILSKIPDRAELRDRLTALWDYERYDVPIREGNHVFFERNTGLQAQSVLYVVDLPRFEPRVLLDPNTLSTDGTVALTGTVPSRDGTLLAYGVAEAGSDWQEWRVRKVDTGQDLPDKIKWVKFSEAEWTPDGKGFYYSRYAEPGPNQLRDVNYFQKLYYHRLGTPQSADKLIYERKDQKEWGFAATVSDDGRWLVIQVSQGTDRRNRVYVQDLARPGSKVQPLVDVLEAKYLFIGSQGPVLWFNTNLDAPRGKVIAIDMRAPDRARWKTLVPETDARLQNAAAVAHRFVLHYLQDAHSVIEVRRLDGKLQQQVKIPAIGTASGFTGRLAHDETYLAFQTFASPKAILKLTPVNGELQVFRAPQLKFEPSEFESRQVFYSSKDGTRVPMTLTFRKGTTPDGERPVLLYGYGGFDISETPTFKPTWLAWMERGGVLAVANLRGGGEYGEEWHQAGMKLKKQNVFDDFIAAAEWLVREKWTRPSRLAIQGGSNGGLLVGAVMTQRPDLIGAALPAVGVMDMLRFQKFTIGWAWTSDYGSSDDPEQFKAIYAYSPLQNIKPGTAYPPTLVLTSDHDDRVVPAHSFKFTAALPAVGVMDMLRFQKFTIGWAWTSDYGSSDDPEQFKAIYAYSPLQNIKPGTAYPPTLVLTSDHDDRVVPAHSFKFTAALQAAQAGPAPVLIRIETRAGHGAGKPTSKKIEEAADMLAFTTWALQLPGGGARAER